jgi:1,4-alpha-glucan branching enzyme
MSTIVKPTPANPVSAKATPKQPEPTVFCCQAPGARAVYLEGTFNGWKPQATPMRQNGHGEWQVALDLPPGRYEYKFVVDGQWCCCPGCDDHQCPPRARLREQRALHLQLRA